MATKRNDTGPPGASEEKSAASERSTAAATDQPAGTDDSAGASHSSSHASEHDQSDAGGKDMSRLLKAVTFGAAGVAGGGVAGALAGWGGIGIAAGGGAVGFPVVVPVAAGPGLPQCLSTPRVIVMENMSADGT